MSPNVPGLVRPVLTLTLTLRVLCGCALAGDLFHHGYHHTVVTASQPLAAQPIQYAPLATVQYAPVATHSVQLFPGNQQIQYAPMSLPVLHYAPTVQWQLTTPTAQSFQSPMTAASPEEQDYQFLSQGFGGRISPIHSLERFVGNEIDRLSKRGVLSRQEVATLVLDAAKGYLTSQGFGFVGPAVDPVLKRLIGRVIGGRWVPDRPNDSTGDETPTPAPSPSTNTTRTDPAVGGVFRITGTVTISPRSDSSEGTSDGAQPHSTATGQPVAQSGGADDGDLITLPTASQNASPMK